MIWAGGITRGGPNTAVLLGNQIIDGQGFLFAISPFSADPLVQILGEGFRQSIRQRLGHDGIVLIVILLEFLRQLLRAMARGDSKSADGIHQPAGSGSNEISERHLRLASLALLLLAQCVKPGQFLNAGRVRVKDNIIAVAAGRIEAINRLGFEKFLFDNFSEQISSVGEQFACRRSSARIIEQIGVAAANLPGMEKRRPIDVRHQFRDRKIRQHPPSDEIR